MGIIENQQVKRLYDSISKHKGQNIADAFTQKRLLRKSPSIKQKSSWAYELCRDMEQSMDEESIKKIRMDCCCKPSKDYIKKSRNIYQKSESLEDYAREASKDSPAKLWVENGSLYMSYPVCYCSYVKNSEITLTKTWCYCSLGYTKYLYENIYECEVEVELLESIKTGGTRCLFKIDKM